jgi:muramidase (phage lysozyme)
VKSPHSWLTALASGTALVAFAGLSGCSSKDKSDGAETSAVAVSGPPAPPPPPRVWKRVCKGQTAVTRYTAEPSGQSAGIWQSETPFLVDKFSADVEFVLGTRGHDGKKAWVPIDKTCDLDERRRMCGARKTDLFWADDDDQKSGRSLYENEVVTLDGAESRGMTRVAFKNAKYWMWSDYLCPIDPNIAVSAVSSSPGGAEGAFFATIGFAEGTGDRYNLIYTFRTFSSYADHPRLVICSRGLCSSAAGRFQILDVTWDGIRRGLPDFSPRSQDEAARRLIRNRGVHGITTRMDYGRFSASIYKLANEWASLPGSPYGQPRKSMNELWRVYSSR